MRTVLETRASIRGGDVKRGVDSEAAESRIDAQSNKRKHMNALRSASFIFALTLLSKIVFSTSAIAAPPKVILRLPYEIKTSGQYVLSKNLIFAGTTGQAISVLTDDVTIDLGGNTLAGSGNADGATVAGIHASGKKNIVIKNGSIRGFTWGIWLDGLATGDGFHRAEKLRVLSCRVIGIWIYGVGSTITNCEVLGIVNPTSLAYGIDVRGTGIDVLNNRVQSNGVGIGINEGVGCTIAGNTVVATSFGILFQGTGTGVRTNNIVQGATTPYQGGTDGGGNL